MSNENGYNGWKNWETWIVNLYFGDDQEYHQVMAEQSDFDLSDMADLIENWVNDYLDDVGKGNLKGLVGEFVIAGLRQVNWYELAENWLSDCVKPLDQDSSYALVEEIEESGYLYTQASNYIQEYGEFTVKTIEKLCREDWRVEIYTDDLDSIDWQLVAEELNTRL